MRRANPIFGLLLAICLAALALPALATASPAVIPLPIPAGTPPQLRALIQARVSADAGGGAEGPARPKFELDAHKYKLDVFGVGTAVVVEVTRGHSKAVTAYVARGTVTPGRIQASFGELGDVAMRFRASGQVALSKPLSHCNGESRYRNRLGVFAGEFRFRGEDGYVSVHAHRAKGEVRAEDQVQCGGRHSLRPQQRASHHSGSLFEALELRSLAASWRHAVSSASFAVLGIGKKVLYIASAEQSKGTVATLRFAVESGPGKAFTLSNALTTARVSPPGPFYGAGTYRAAPDGTTTWTGALAVNFPGAPRFPLAGPQFKAAVGAGF
jgi:hypothetical protein